MLSEFKKKTRHVTSPPPRSESAKERKPEEEKQVVELMFYLNVTSAELLLSGTALGTQSREARAETRLHYTLKL